jgi:Stress responsive A/B Barrel Domain
MIRHIVLFYLGEGITGAGPRVKAAVDAEETLRTEVPEGRDWCFGPNLSDRVPAADFVGVADFDSAQQLQRFLRHPAHTRAAALWQDIASWSVADLDLDGWSAPQEHAAG